MAIEINRSYDYGEDEQAKKIRLRKELEEKMKQFLEKGGKVEKIEPHEPTKEQLKSWRI
jgi:hypothetical protein